MTGPMSLYELCNSLVALDAYRRGKVIHTRFVSRVCDYSQPEQLTEGQSAVVEIYAIDRGMHFVLDEGQALQYDSDSGEASFISNGMLYRIRPLTDPESSRFS